LTPQRVDRGCRRAAGIIRRLLARADGLRRVVEVAQREDHRLLRIRGSPTDHF